MRLISKLNKWREILLATFSKTLGIFLCLKALLCFRVETFLGLLDSEAFVLVAGIMVLYVDGECEKNKHRRTLAFKVEGLGNDHSLTLASRPEWSCTLSSPENPSTFQPGTKNYLVSEHASDGNLPIQYGPYESNEMPKWWFKLSRFQIVWRFCDPD